MYKNASDCILRCQDTFRISFGWTGLEILIAIIGYRSTPHPVTVTFSTILAFLSREPLWTFICHWLPGWGVDPSYRQLIVVDCHATKRPVFEAYQSYYGPSAERAIGPSPNASKMKAHHAMWVIHHNSSMVYTIWMFPKIVVPPKSSILFNTVFHWKPSILGYPYFILFLETPIWFIRGFHVFFTHGKKSLENTANQLRSPNVSAWRRSFAISRCEVSLWPRDTQRMDSNSQAHQRSSVL